MSLIQNIWRQISYTTFSWMNLVSKYLCNFIFLYNMTFKNQIKIPCEIQLLEMTNSSFCLPVTIKITKTTFKQLDNSKWIELFFKDDIVELSATEILRGYPQVQYSYRLSCYLIPLFPWNNCQQQDNKFQKNQSSFLK